MDISELLAVGLKFDYEPLPHDPASTKMFDAGPVTIGLEYRHLTDQAAEAAYGPERTAEIRKMTGVTAATPVNEIGLSIHVFGDDKREYLRFDCFEDEPHYHYLMPNESFQRVVPFDTAAHGDPLAWTLSSLRTRLAPMLRKSGGARMADQLNPAVLNETLDRVEKAAQEIVAAQAA